MIFVKILEVVTTHLIKKLTSNKGFPVPQSFPASSLFQ